MLLIHVVDNNAVYLVRCVYTTLNIFSWTEKKLQHVFKVYLCVISIEMFVLQSKLDFFDRALFSLGWVYQDSWSTNIWVIWVQTVLAVIADI